MLAMVVHPADTQDRDGARPVLEAALAWHPTLTKAWADGGYAGQLVEWAKERKLDLEIVKKPPEGFKVLPRRWVVERTFAWIVRNRRLRCDYEATISSVAGYIRLAMIRVMVRRLTVAS
jgi:transposase